MIKGGIKMKKINIIISTCLFLMVTGCSKPTDYVAEFLDGKEAIEFEKEIQEEYPDFVKHDVSSLFELNYHNEKSMYINVYHNNEVIRQLFRIDREEDVPQIKFYTDFDFDFQMNTVKLTGYWVDPVIPINAIFGIDRDLEQDIEELHVAKVSKVEKEDIENKDHIYLLAVSFDTPFDETNLQEDIDKRIENGDLIVTVLLDY